MDTQQHGGDLLGRSLQQTIPTKLEQRVDLLGYLVVVAGVADAPRTPRTPKVQEKPKIQIERLLPEALVGPHAHHASHAKPADLDGVERRAEGHAPSIVALRGGTSHDLRPALRPW